MKIINKSCEVICSFDKEGKIRPHKVRVKAENEEYIVIEVSKLMSRDNVRVNGELYLTCTCQGVVNDLMRTFELRLHRKESKWYLYKM